MKTYTDRIEELIDRYDLADGAKHGRPGMILIKNRDFAQRDNVVPEIRDNKSQILARLAEMEQRKAEELAAKQARAKLREELIAQIEGLAEIKAAMEDLRKWRIEFNRSFEGENAVGGLGVRPKPSYDIDAMLEAYPRAAAYLEAERMSRRESFDLRCIGEKALDEVIFGDWNKALADMAADEEEYVESHLWD